jgi:hypothetical protein
MKIKNEVLKKGGKVAYKLGVGDGRFIVSEMPVEVAAEIIAKGKKGEEVNGYMKIDDYHYVDMKAIDFEESDKKAGKPDLKPNTKPDTTSDKSVKKD